MKQAIYIPVPLLLLLILSTAALFIVWLSDRHINFGPVMNYGIHAFAFWLGSLVTFGVIERMFPAKVQPYIIVITLLALSFFAAYTEHYQKLHQKHHELDVNDWYLDELGIALGLLTYLGLMALTQYLQKRKRLKKV